MYKCFQCFYDVPFFFIWVWLKEYILIMKIHKAMSLLNWYFSGYIWYINKIRTNSPKFAQLGKATSFDFLIYSHRSLRSSLIFWPPNNFHYSAFMLTPHLKNQHFFKESWFPLEANIWVPSMLIVIGASLLLDSSSG